MNQPIMNALDAVAGSQASAYITMADGNRYCFMQLYSFESNMEINVAEVPILGKSGKGNKPTGWTGARVQENRLYADLRHSGFQRGPDRFCRSSDDYPEELPH